MKKSELFFSALQVPVDYVMLVLSGILAFFLRQSGGVVELRPILYQNNPRDYIQLLLVAAAFFVIIFAIEGLYNIRSTKRTLGEIYRVFRAITIGIMIIVVGIFFNREWYSSRFVIIAGGVFSILLVSLGRYILGFFQRYLLTKKNIGIHRLLLIGINGYCSEVKRAIVNDSGLGYMVVGHLESIDLERISRIKKMKGIDEIIECHTEANRDDLYKLKEYCIQNRIVFKYVPTLLQTANFDLQTFLGEPIIEIKNTPLDGWGKIIKRIFDIVGALIGIILFGPVMLVVAILTYLESGKPIIFCNERVGDEGLFDVFKFRYMKKEYCHGKQFDAEHNEKALDYLQKLIDERSTRTGPLYKIKDDPRKTKLGAIIEKFSLDELPQFFNVLLGNMSMVGPRPHQPIEVDKYEDYQKRVLTIKPGITGMAQVSGRSDLDFKDEVRLDVYYIENWSLWLDVIIIFKTVLTLWKKRKNS